MGPGIDLPGKDDAGPDEFMQLQEASMGPGIDLPGKSSATTNANGESGLQWGPG